MHQPCVDGSQSLLFFVVVVVQTLRTKCFDKCVTKPGSSLGGSESSCISRCVERYMEATAIISRSLFTQRWSIPATSSFFNDLVGISSIKTFYPE